ncbi:MAG: hypothetical protein GX046_02485 [Tissierellia bacterium]|nr:hypothetical protein [Tissierellia bacterium]
MKIYTSKKIISSPKLGFSGKVCPSQDQKLCSKLPLPPCSICQGSTIKWGKSVSNIRISQAFGHPTLLELGKSRYHCKACGYPHTLEAILVEKH